MPSRPVVASNTSRPDGEASESGDVSVAASSGSAANSRNATTVQSRFSVMQTSAARVRPKAGISQNATPSTPSTAPKVLPAYRAAIWVPSRRNCARTRSMAGRVAPMAAVAGSRSRKAPQKATVHCQAAAGRGPVRSSSQPAIGPIDSARTKLHAPITASQAAYQRAGCALRSMRDPSSAAPTASPPKKAATTAKTAAASCPSHRALCWVQTI